MSDMLRSVLFGISLASFIIGLILLFGNKIRPMKTLFDNHGMLYLGMVCILLVILPMIIIVPTNYYYYPLETDGINVSITDKYDCSRYVCRDTGFKYVIVGDEKYGEFNISYSYATDDKLLYDNLSVGNNYCLKIDDGYNWMKVKMFYEIC